MSTIAATLQIGQANIAALGNQTGVGNVTRMSRIAASTWESLDDHRSVPIGGNPLQFPQFIASLPARAVRFRAVSRVFAVSRVQPSNMRKPKVVYSGKYLQLRVRGTWEYAHRPRITGIVGIVAISAADEIVLIRQFRPALGCDVIEIPAGLAGDIAGSENEGLAVAAKRELLEETGYSARSMKPLTHGASSAGITDEVIHLFRATGLKKVADASRDSSEQITTHLIPLRRAEAWIKRQQREGAQVDLKVFAALHFARRIR